MNSFLTCTVFSFLLLLPLSLRAQEIQVLGGDGLNDVITDGETTIRTSEGTNFGNENVTGGAEETTFRIRNTNSRDFNAFNDLSISSITVTTTTSSTTASPHFSISAGAPLPLFPIALNGQSTHNFTVRFDPSATGTHTAVVRIRNNDSNEDPYTFRVRGTGVGVPEISVSGNGFNIPDGSTGTSAIAGTNFGEVNALAPDAVRTFRVHNTGTGTLTLSFSDNNSPHFRFSSTTGSIAPGNFDDFNVFFDPQQSGTLSTDIRIDNNDPNEDPYTFRVTGTARAPEIQVLGGTRRDDNISLGDPTPTTAEHTIFGSIDINGGAIARIFRIRNTATSALAGPLLISRITESSPHFSVPLQVYPPILPGGFHDITVHFNPTAIGTFDTILSIHNNDIDGNEDPYTFTIRGTGTGSPEIVVEGRPQAGVYLNIPDGDVSPQPFDGTDFGNLGVTAGSVSHQFRIRNVGSAPLTISATENSSAFSISGLSTTVPPGGTDNFNITFNPNTSGRVSTDITIDTNDPDGGEDPYTFRVTGIGTAPEIEVRGGVGFSRVIADNDGTPSTVDHTDFGARDLLAAPLNRTFQIRNTGNQTLLVTSVTVSNNPTFAMLPVVVPPILPGGSANFTVGFDPTEIGDHNAQVTILNTDSNEGTYNFAVTGEGTGSPEISVFGKPLGPLDGVQIADNDLNPSDTDGTRFAPLDVNLGRVTHTFRIKNTGSTNLSVGLNSTSNAFTISGVNSPIAPNFADDFNISFNPSATGNHEADIIITNNDPDGNENPYVFRVSGRGTGPDIGVSGGRFLSIPIPDEDDTPRTEDHTDFGIVEIREDSARDREFRISNDAIDDGNPLTQNLVIGNITITGPGSQFFSIRSLPIILPLFEGANASLVIRYNPTEEGVHEATVTIPSNDPDSEDPYTFLIRGEATSSPEIAVLAVGLLSESPIPNGDTNPTLAKNTDFGRPDVNGPPTIKPFRIRNTGNQTLVVSATVSGSSDFTVSGLARTIAAGRFDDFEITFDPTSTGDREATIVIDNNDPDDGEDPYTFLVRAQGRAPEIAVFTGRENAFEILHGDDTPDPLQNTDFGEVEIGANPVNHHFQIHNQQNSDGIPLTWNLIISNIRIIGEGADQFSVVSPLILPIEEEGFGVLTIRFAPRAVGTHEATVLISHNDPDDAEAPFRFDIVGVATGEPDLQVFGIPIPLLSDGTEISNGDESPQEIDGTDFGYSDVYALLDRTHTFRIRNRGNVPLTVSVDEDSPHFQITESLNRTIGSGDFDDFNITYDPRTSGRHEATVTLTSDDPDEDPYTFLITGRAYAPEIEVHGGNGFAFEIENGDDTPEGNDGTEFGEIAVSSGLVEHTFRITNTLDPSGVLIGTGMLIIDRLTVSNPDNFSIVSGAFPPPLLPGASHQFVVRFDPADSGLQTAEVFIGNNDPDGGDDPYTFTVQGTGLGEPEIAVFGLPIPFITDGIPIENGADSPALINGTHFGRALAGSLLGDPANTFRIRNSGAGPLNVDVSIDSDQFEISIPPADRIDAENFSDFTIVFNPSESGNHTATVTIANDDPTGDENPYTFQIAGVAWAPEIAVFGGADFRNPISSGSTSPNPDAGTDMGGALLSGSIERTFRIHNIIANNGSPFSGNLRVFRISVTNSDVFSISSGAPVQPIPIVIPEQQFHEFNVRFTPNGNGEFRGMVSIQHDDPDDDENPYTFEIIARAGDPDIHVSSFTIQQRFVEIANGSTNTSFGLGTEFRFVDVGDRATQTFRILNGGGSDLTVTIETDSPEFQPSVRDEQTIAMNTSLEFDLIFEPVRPGDKEAMVTITSNDPDENPYIFKVSAEVLGADIDVLGGPDFDLPIAAGDDTPEAADRTDFGRVKIDSEVTHTFRIHNPGNLTLAISSLELEEGSSPAFTIESPPERVRDGEFEEFSISFAPTTVGTHTATVTIGHSGDGPAPDPYTFRIQGNAPPTLPDGLRDKFRPRFSLSKGEQGQRIASLNFQTEADKTYRIVTTTDLETWEVIPELSGLTGLGDVLAVDLTPWLPSETNRTRYFRVEEEDVEE